MAARLGNVIYWGMCLLAGLATVLAVMNAYGPTGGKFMVVLFGVIAVVLWLLGRGAQYILSGR